MATTQEAQDPVVRVESDLLRFCPSRGWEIKIVTFPASPHSDVVVPHGLTVDTPEAIQYQVLQTNCPQIIYHDPTAIWTHSEIRLRSTTSNGQAVILLTTSKLSQPKLNRLATGTFRIGPVTIPLEGWAAAQSGWLFSATGATIDGDRTVHTIAASDAVPPTFTLSMAQNKSGGKSGQLTITGDATAAGPTIGGLAGTTFGGSSIRLSGSQLRLVTLSDTITATQNNYSPTGWPTASILYCTPSGGNRDLTGLSYLPPYTNWTASGRSAYIINNDSANLLTLWHDDAASSASNRFNLPNGRNLTLSPGEGVQLVHNGTNWGMVGRNDTFNSTVYVNAGVKFPATQVASSDANTLDDYEEGTWTPVIGGLTSESGQSYGAQEGHYLKVGRHVTLWCYVALAAKGTITGALVLKGLPFTVAPSPPSQYAPLVCSYWNSLATSWVYIAGYAHHNSTFAYIQGNTSAAASTFGLTGSDVGNSSGFMFRLSYYAAS